MPYYEREYVARIVTKMVHNLSVDYHVSYPHMGDFCADIQTTDGQN